MLQPTAVPSCHDGGVSPASAPPSTTRAAVRYTVEERELERAGPDALRIWGESLESMGDGGRSKLDWFYEGAPAGRGRLLLLGADGAAAPVGCIGIGFRRVARAGARVQAALLADLAVEAAHRTLFPAVALVRRAREVAATSAALQYGFPNQAAEGVFRRVGYHLVGRMARYVRVLRFSEHVSRRIPLAPVAPLARAAGAVLDVADALRAAPPRLRAAAHYRLDFATGPDARLDALFEEAQRGVRAMGERGAEAIRWRFFERRPGAELALLVRRADGVVRGYAVIVRRGEVASLADFLAATEDDLDALIALLVPTLRARGYASASLRFLGPASIAAVLVRRGFVLREATRAVMAAAGSAPLPPEQRDPEGWYLTDADEDE